MYCHRCGKELAPGAAYCHSCGAKVGEYSPAEWWWTWHREQRDRLDREPTDAVWGAISAVGVLVILALTIVRYPDVFTLVVRYLESWQAFNRPVLPPYALGQVVVFFFAACGIWGVVAAGSRLALTGRLRQPLRDFGGALFSLYVAFAFSQFYARTLNGVELVLAFLMGLAALVIANALISLFLPRRWRNLPPTGTTQNPSS